MAIEWKPLAGAPEPEDRVGAPVERFNGQKLFDRCDALGAGSLFCALVCGRTPVKMERTEQVGDWLLDDRLVSSNAPEWWELARPSPLLLLAGTGPDFHTLDTIGGSPQVRCWDHERGFGVLPRPVSLQSWMHDQIRRFVENELLPELEDAESGGEAAALADLRCELKRLADESEQSELEAWWAGTWWAQESW